MANITGWPELINGSIAPATYAMYNDAFMGMFMVVLYAFGLGMLYLRTRNLGLIVGLQLVFLVSFGTYLNVGGLTAVIAMFCVSLALFLYQVFVHGRQMA